MTTTKNGETEITLTKNDKEKKCNKKTQRKKKDINNKMTDVRFATNDFELKHGSIHPSLGLQPLPQPRMAWKMDFIASWRICLPGKTSDESEATSGGEVFSA